MAQPNINPYNFLSRNYTNLLRGLCMIAIVWSHTANEFTEILKEYHVSSLLSSGMYATGIFFFLSGYGLTLSIKRNRIDCDYIRIHIQKLLLPYLIFWLFYILCGLLCGYFPVQSNMCVDFISLKIPNADTGFFRTILALYILYLGLASFLKQYVRLLFSALYVLIYLQNVRSLQIFLCSPL